MKQASKFAVWLLTVRIEKNRRLERGVQGAIAT